MKFLADENIPLKVIKNLRKSEINITSISEQNPGATDIEVIKLAQKENRIIITFDKEFGEFIFNKKYQIPGIILLRLKPHNADYIFREIRNLLNKPEIQIKNNFIILEEKRVRIRQIKNQ